MTIEHILNHPVFMAGASVLVVALVNAIVKQIGKGAKTPARIAALEKSRSQSDEALASLADVPGHVKALDSRQAATEELNRLTLRVLDHQTAGIKAALEALQGNNNGNVSAAIRRMNQAESETKEFLFASAVPQEDPS